MRILVIGGTNFIGPYVVKRLLQKGHQVAVFNRGKTKKVQFHEVQHIQGDRNRFFEHVDNIKKFSPDVVLDMFPYTQRDAQLVMDTCKGLTQRVVALSSLDVYRAYSIFRRLEEGDLEPVPLKESAPLRSSMYPYRGIDESLYHYEKILVEQTVLGEQELPGTILRLPMVYGPEDDRHRTFEYVKRMADQRPYIILEEEAAHWSWTRGYVENVAEAIVLATTDVRASGKIYNVGEVPSFTLREWVLEIAKIFEWKGEMMVLPKERLTQSFIYPYEMKQDIVIDTSLIRKELGYAEVVDRKTALKKTMTWELNHPPKDYEWDYEREDQLVKGHSPT